MALPAEHYFDAIALWILHTHPMSARETTPRLVIRSPEKQSGKTKMLKPHAV